jgi:hypothetical protein
MDKETAQPLDQSQSLRDLAEGKLIFNATISNISGLDV